MSVGMPQELLLQEFGSQVWAVFGSCPYLVGSALNEKSGWRDVDVRMILDDAIWEAMDLGPTDQVMQNAKWVSLCLAYSALGKAMTGLPIDFQLQKQTEANAKFPGNRSALGVIPLRMSRP